jgi:hypothetical protein
MQNLYILFIATLLLSATHAGKGKYKNLRNSLCINQNPNQPRNSVTKGADEARPVEDAGNIHVLMEALNTTIQYKVKGMSMNSLTIHAVMMSTGLEGLKDAILKTSWSTSLVSIDDIEYKATKFCLKSSISRNILSGPSTFMFLDGFVKTGSIVKFESACEMEDFHYLFAQYCIYSKIHRYGVPGHPDMSQYELGYLKGWYC